MQAPFPQRGLSEWRIKPTNLHSSTEQTEQARKESLQANQDLTTHTIPHQTQVDKKTEEQVLKDLDEATLLYLSCPDPQKLQLEDRGL